MAKPTNIGAYHQDLKYPDENPFYKAWEEGAEKSRNLAAQAYAVKKTNFLNDFWVNLNEDFMPPPDAPMIVMNKASGKYELQDNFFKFDDLTPMQIYRFAQSEAKEYGLNPNAVKLSDIKSPQLAQLHAEAVKERYKKLEAWRRENGTAELNEILDTTPGWNAYYARNTDPYVDEPLYTGGKLTEANKGRDKEYKTISPQYLKAVNQGDSGWKLDSKGNVTNIPYFWDWADKKDGGKIHWDEKGAYVKGGWGTALDAMATENMDVDGMSSKVYLPGYGSELHDWNWEDDFYGYNKEEAQSMLYTAYHKDLQNIEW